MMRPCHALLAVSMVFASCLYPSAARAVEGGLDAMLAEAEAARTANTQRLDEIIEAAAPLLPDGTERQRRRFEIITAHRKMTLGRPEEAVAIMAGSNLMASSSDSENYLVWSMMANAYVVMRDFTNALRATESMLALRDAVGDDPSLLHRGLMVAASVYSQTGEYGLGIRYAEEVLAGGPDARNRCAAEIVVMEGRVGLAEGFGDDYSSDVLLGCDALGEPIFSGLARLHVAREWARVGRLDEALAMIEGALPAVEGIGYSFLTGHYHAQLAAIHSELADTAAALEHARRSVQHESSIRGSEALVGAWRLIYEAAEAGGDPAVILPVYRKYAEAQRAYLSDVRSREMAHQIVRHQSQQQAQQIELLAQQNAWLELEQTLTRQRARLWLAMALLLSFLLVSIAYWAYKTKRLQMRLQRLAETDTLTGLSNRGHFTGQAQRVLEEHRRTRDRAALVMLDLDYFKQVNDRFGHAAGDWVLAEVARACREASPAGSCIARLGGEEFAILLPGADVQVGRGVAETLLQRLIEVDTAASGHDIRLSASFGVADTAGGGYELSRLLSHADRAMYAAKGAGRGRVRVAGDVVPSPVSEPRSEGPVQTAAMACPGSAAPRMLPT